MPSNPDKNNTPYEQGGYRHVLKLVIPMVLSNAAFTVMEFTDRVLLARYSSEAIQASLPAGVLSFTLISFFAAIAGYSSTFVSQYYGAKDEKGAAKSCMTGVLLSVIAGPVFLLMIPLSSWIMAVSGHTGALLAAEKQYAFWLILAGTPLALHWTLSGYLTGRSRVVANTIVSVACCVINIGLDIVLIFGYCGFPRMGIEGAAIATFASQVIGIFILLGAIFTDRIVRALPWKEIVKPDWYLFRRIVHFGFPAGIQVLFDAGSFTFFSLLVAKYDALSLAASNIAFSINHLAISPIMGFGNAAAVIVGQFQGAGQSDLARKSCWRCQYLAWGYMLAIGAMFLAFPTQLLEIFQSPDSPYTTAELISLGRVLLVILAAWGMFDTLSAVLGGGLRGAGDTHYVMKVILGCNWLFWIPLELIIICVLHLGIIHAWIGMLVFIILFAVAIFWRWQNGKWADIKVVR